MVATPVDAAEAVIKSPRDANVVASVREGKFRLTVHFYILEEEIDRAAEVNGSVSRRSIARPHDARKLESPPPRFGSMTRSCRVGGKRLGCSFGREFERRGRSGASMVAV